MSDPVCPICLDNTVPTDFNIGSAYLLYEIMKSQDKCTAARDAACPGL